jgi:DNA-binding SARP family transcriptional activator
MSLSEDLHLSLLAGFRLGDAREPVPLSPGSQRLLAFLALRDAPVTRDLAAGRLWPAASECRAHANLRAALARLGQVRDRVVRSAGADLALVDGVQVDVRTARRLATALTGGALPEATATATAIALLSYELLPGWYEEWVLNEAEEWRQLRLHALETLADRLRAAGRFGEAAAAAVAAVGADELRESARAALVRVHLAEGNQSEALREFERYRALLRSARGLEPTPRLRGLLPGHAAVTLR